MEIIPLPRPGTTLDQNSAAWLSVYRISGQLQQVQVPRRALAGLFGDRWQGTQSYLLHLVCRYESDLDVVYACVCECVCVGEHGKLRQGSRDTSLRITSDPADLLPVQVYRQSRHWTVPPLGVCLCVCVFCLLSFVFICGVV